MTYPTVTVEFSPTTGPFDTPVWVDITARVLSADWVDGKQADLAEYAPGQGTVVLENSDRLFDPEHAAGAYYGLLNPRVPFRIRAVHSAVTYDEFYGFVEDGWRQDMEPPAVASCIVDLVDLLGILNGYTLPSVLEAQILALGPVAYWPLQELQGATSVADESAAYDGTVVGEPRFGEDPLGVGLGTSAEFDGVDDRIDIGRAQLIDGFVAATFVAVFATSVPAEALSIHPLYYQSDGNGDLATNYIVYVSTVGTIERIATSGGGGLTRTNTQRIDDGDPHLVMTVGGVVDPGVCIDSATSDSATVAGAGQTGSGTALAGTPQAGRNYDDNYFPGRLAHVAIFDYGMDLPTRQLVVDAWQGLAGASSGDQIQWALDQIGVPASMVDLDTGVAVMGPAVTSGKDALEFMREVAATEQGDLYVAHHDGGKLRFRDRYASFQDTRSTATQATFSDDPAVADTAACRVEPGSLVVEPNGVSSIINQATVGWVGGEEVVDASAGSPYGPRPVSLRTQAPNPLTARGIGQWIVANNAVPAARVKALTVNPGANHAEFPMTLGVRIADRVAYRSHPQSTGTATTKALEVLGRRHRIEGVQWVSTFYLTEHPDQGIDLFTLGTSELGGTHILAY